MAAEKVHILSRDTIQHFMPRIVTAPVFDRWTGRRSTADVQRVGLIKTWQNEISTRDRGSPYWSRQEQWPNKIHGVHQ